MYTVHTFCCCKIYKLYLVSLVLLLLTVLYLYYWLYLPSSRKNLNFCSRHVQLLTYAMERENQFEIPWSLWEQRANIETSLLKKWPHVQVSAKWKFNTIWAHILLLHCWVFWWFCENVIIDGNKAFPTLLHFLEWNIAAPNLVECSISFNSQLAKLQKYNFPFCSRNGDMIRDNCKKLTEKFR